MKEYYFLASLLPTLEIGRVPTLGFAEFKELLEINLTKGDFAKVVQFFRFIDLENFRAFWAKEPIDPRGNLKKEEIELALINQQWSQTENFPYYLRDYLDKYRTDEERLHNFPLLLQQFFLYVNEKEEGFLKEYFAFQRELRLILVGFRAKKVGKDLFAELQWEDPTDPIVAQVLAQKDEKKYEPPFEYKELKPIFDEFGNDPLALHKALIEYQFNTLVASWGGEHFSLDRILSYMARLLLVERWLELNIQEGMKVIDSIEHVSKEQVSNGG